MPQISVKSLQWMGVWIVLSSLALVAVGATALVILGAALGSALVIPSVSALACKK